MVVLSAPSVRPSVNRSVIKIVFELFSPHVESIGRSQFLRM